MTLLLRKEIRSLFPAWGLTMAATALMAFVRDEWGPVLVVLAAVGVVLLGITSFGSEFGHGTFSLLLAQPIPRNRIWWMKIITLGAALLSVAIMLLLVCVCQFLRSGSNFRIDDWIMPAVFTVLLFGAAFAGGLLSALATRQMATAFWIALLGPLAVCAAAAIFTIERSEKAIQISIATSLAVYDILAFLLARRQFLRAQDVPGASGTVVSLPAWMRFGAKGRFSAKPHSHHPLRALISKELQSNQVSLLVAAVLFVLHIIVLLIRRMIAHPDDSGLFMALSCWWLLWFVFPVMIAGSAIAEERRQGTLEGFLCLPARKSAQWFIKCTVCVFLSVLLGGVMPWLLESAGRWIGRPSLFLEHSNQFLRSSVTVAAVMTLLGLYASSLARNLLQALGVALLVGSVFGFFAAQIADWARFRGGLGLFLSPYDLAPFASAFIALFLWLSYTNFKHFTLGWRQWVANASVLLVVAFLVCGLVVLFVQPSGFESKVPIHPGLRRQQNYLAPPLSGSSINRPPEQGKPRTQSAP